MTAKVFIVFVMAVAVMWGFLTYRNAEESLIERMKGLTAVVLFVVGIIVVIFGI